MKYLRLVLAWSTRGVLLVLATYGSWAVYRDWVPTAPPPRASKDFVGGVHAIGPRVEMTLGDAWELSAPLIRHRPESWTLYVFPDASPAGMHYLDIFASKETPVVRYQLKRLHVVIRRGPLPPSFHASPPERTFASSF